MVLGSVGLPQTKPKSERCKQAQGSCWWTQEGIGKVFPCWRAKNVQLQPSGTVGKMQRSSRCGILWCYRTQPQLNLNSYSTEGAPYLEHLRRQRANGHKLYHGEHPILFGEMDEADDLLSIFYFLLVIPGMSQVRVLSYFLSRYLLDREPRVLQCTLDHKRKSWAVC